MACSNWSQQKHCRVSNGLNQMEQKKMQFHIKENINMILEFYLIVFLTNMSV